MRPQQLGPEVSEVSYARTNRDRQDQADLMSSTIKPCARFGIVTLRRGAMSNGVLVRDRIKWVVSIDLCDSQRPSLWRGGK